jgi:hypothetical protein
MLHGGALRGMKTTRMWGVQKLIMSGGGHWPYRMPLTHLAISQDGVSQSICSTGMLMFVLHMCRQTLSYFYIGRFLQFSSAQCGVLVNFKLTQLAHMAQWARGLCMERCHIQGVQLSLLEQ